MKKIVPIILFLCISFTLFSEEKPVIAVFDFVSGGLSDSEVKHIAELMSSSIFHTGQYSVIDIAQRELILEEISFSMSDCVDEACQIKAGKQLAADLIVVGRISRIEDSYIMSAKILQVRTALVINTHDKMYPSLGKLFSEINSFVEKLTGYKIASESRHNSGSVYEKTEKDAEIIKSGKKGTVTEESKPEKSEENQQDTSILEWSIFQASIWGSDVQLVSESTPIYGMRICFPYGYSQNITGLDLGIVNSGTYVRGWQTALVNITDKVDGVQCNLVNINSKVTGAQVNMLFSKCKEGKWFQMGLVNYAEKYTGVQIGLVNYTLDMDGLQIGLANFSPGPKGQYFFPFLNICF